MPFQVERVVETGVRIAIGISKERESGGCQFTHRAGQGPIVSLSVCLLDRWRHFLKPLWQGRAL